MRFVRPLLFIAGIIAMFYGIAVAGLYGEQRSMLFAGAGNRCPSEIPDGYRAVRFITADGEQISGLYRPAAVCLGSILFFHGNADSAFTGVALFAPMTAAGDGALLVEYCGYCGDTGSPDEQGLYRDGEAALKWLGEAGVGRKQLIVAGYSLGTGVATKVAAEHQPAGVYSSRPTPRLPMLPVTILAGRRRNC